MTEETLLTTQFLLVLASGTLIPILNGLVTKYAAKRTRSILQVALNLAAGVLSEAIAGGAGFDWGSALIAAGVSFVTAVAMEAGVWAPLGVSEKAKQLGSRRDYELAA